MNSAGERLYNGIIKENPTFVRVPAFIVIVASFVTIVQFLLQAYIPSLNESLGLYIPLIVVNCIILGRAEAYASKNPMIASLFDGIGMGLGFTVGEDPERMQFRLCFLRRQMRERKGIGGREE